MTIFRQVRPLAASLTVVALVAAACGSGDADSADTDPAESGPPATELPGTDPPDTAPPVTELPGTDPPDTAPPVTDLPTDDDAECPAAPPLPTLTPVDPAALPLPPEEELAPLAPGRYGDERLGLSLALDIPDGFEVPNREASTLTFYGLEGNFSLLRPAGFVTEFPEPDVEPPLVDIDAWLASGLVTIQGETPTEVAGYPARNLLVSIDAPDGVAPVSTNYAIESPFALLEVVDVGDVPLLAIGEPPAGDPGPFFETVESMLSSVAIGEIGPSFDTIYADTPWDVGNMFIAGPEPIGACTVPLVAFGGTQFDLAAPARVAGQGDEIWIDAPDEPWEGSAPPYITLVGPETMTEMVDFTRVNGAPLRTTADAVAALEAVGYTLTVVESEATLLGAPVDAFEFTGPDEPVTAWLARSNPVSVGDGNIEDPPFRAGLMYIAETDAGVIVARVDGEQGTNDIELMRERFDVMVETLALR